MRDDNGQAIEIFERETVLCKRPRIVVPQSWWLRVEPLDENAVCLREQVIAELMMIGGLL